MNGRYINNAGISVSKPSLFRKVHMLLAMRVCIISVIAGCCLMCTSLMPGPLEEIRTFPSCRLSHGRHAYSHKTVVCKCNPLFGCSNIHCVEKRGIQVFRHPSSLLSSFMHSPKARSRSLLSAFVLLYLVPNHMKTVVTHDFANMSVPSRTVLPFLGWVANLSDPRR